MHDAHARSPDSIRELFKTWRKRPASQVGTDPAMIDPYSPNPKKVSYSSDIKVSETDLADLIDEFCDSPAVSASSNVELPPAPAFEIKGLPGLQVFPSLLPPCLQIALLDKLLHRDLSNPVHKTNLHLHHHVQYPETNHETTSSFFAEAHDTILQPKDPAVHNPITYRQMLESKLRWITLGGQYDWTSKIYPDEAPPPFPPDIATLLMRLFPNVDAQAAIVNFYSPGDTLSVHRDVSEDSDQALISISVGCDGIFLIGNEDGNTVTTIRLRSGDAILMSGASRYAWHGVPKILADTCPQWLQDWPDMPQGNRYQRWRGWMTNKRINLNVRQMTETTPLQSVSAITPPITVDSV